MVNSILQGFRFSAHLRHFPEIFIPLGRQNKPKTIYSLWHVRSLLRSFSNFPDLSRILKFLSFSVPYTNVHQRIIPINLMARIIENDGKLVR